MWGSEDPHIHQQLALWTRLISSGHSIFPVVLRCQTSQTQLAAVLWHALFGVWRRQTVKSSSTAIIWVYIWMVEEDLICSMNYWTNIVYYLYPFIAGNSIDRKISENGKISALVFPREQGSNIYNAIHIRPTLFPHTREYWKVSNRLQLASWKGYRLTSFMRLIK